jgi:hypothetical protein
VGMRGSKARRKGQPRPDRAPQGMAPILTEEDVKPPGVREHEQRNAARMAGLLIPPSPAEKQGLEEKGHRVPTSGLWVP